MRSFFTSIKGARSAPRAVWRVIPARGHALAGGVAGWRARGGGRDAPHFCVFVTLDWGAGFSLRTDFNRSSMTWCESRVGLKPGYRLSGNGSASGKPGCCRLEPVGISAPSLRPKIPWMPSSPRGTHIARDSM